LTAAGRLSARRLRAARWFGGGAAILAWLCAGDVRAQESASITVQSDYLLRGVSLSDGRPTLGIELDYDDKSGAYGAVSATAVDTRHAGLELLSVVADIGYAKRLSNGLTWDVGVSDSQISTFVDGRYDANYAEIYAGVARGPLALHVYFSPGYLGETDKTIYVDLTGTVRPANHWRLTAHAGLLSIVDGRAYALGGRNHVDLRAGVARDFGRFEVRLNATWTDPRPVYPEGVAHGRAALVAGASVNF
jgi:uncharacterized protein (TIGR02001 family)